MAQSSGEKDNFFSRVPIFAQQVKAETAKVVWPSRRETVMTAVMVVIMTMTLGIFFFAVDWGFSRIVRFLLSLVQG